MKVQVEIDQALSEPEIIIRTPKLDDQVEAIKQKLLATQNERQTLVGYLGETEHFVAVDEVLFIETAERQLQVHTATQIFISKQRLYAIEEALPGYFLQISKSTIVNLHYVNALTKSLSSCLVAFRGTPKTVYASRRYYKQLQERLNEMRSLS